MLFLKKIMKIKIDGINISKIENGIQITSEEDMYILGNIHGYDFRNKKSFNNHYSNNPELKRVIVQRHGISVISTIEKFKDKFFTNISVLLDVKLDNITMLYIYNTIHQTISTTLYKNNAISKDKLDNELGNFYNVVYIACRGKADKYLPYDISLFYEVKEILDEALNKSLKYINYPQNITETLKDYHITNLEKTAEKICENINMDKFKKQLQQAIENPDTIAYLNMCLHLIDDTKNQAIDELQDNKPNYKQLISKNLAKTMTTENITQTLNKIYEILPHKSIEDNIKIGLITGILTNMK